MTPAGSPRGRQRRATHVPTADGVAMLDAARIARALAGRARYRYVRPRVERFGAGWRIASPNCSRNVDGAGGDIDIAWFEPTPAGHWIVHGRDHGAAAWVAHAVMFTLAAALDFVCNDPDRRFWP